ncbi:MAG: methionyl-tRNA formyltransferase [Alphaproteobacteria bacterium]
MGRLRLVFMGTSTFAVPSLEALCAAGHEVRRVYTQPPRPAGRGWRPKPSPVEAAAETLGLEVRTPDTLKDPAEHAAFVRLEPEAAVVAAYGLLLPPEVLRAPRLGCLNVHPSLLPRWRGAAPVARTILAGDRETGVTIIEMDEGLDTGPILMVERLPVAADATAGSLESELAERGAALLIRALEDLARGELVSRPQPSQGVTYAFKLRKDEGRIDWRRPAAELGRMVRGLSPTPAAFFEDAGMRVKVLAAEVAAGKGRPGELLAQDLTVACGDGALRLSRVQRAGRAPTDGAAFLRGLRLPPGTVFA